MGLIDNSTNSPILDAVLTDAGRALIAANDGSFRIQKFAFGDDEVDYTIIKRYGRTVGREKIEKNTPVFEAITTSAQAFKNRLITVSNPNLVRLPTFSLSGDSNVNGTSNIISLGSLRQRGAKISIEQTIQDEQTIDVELRDQNFSVEISNLFLGIFRRTPDSIDSRQTAKYILPRSAGENAFQGSTLQFTLSVKSITNAQFNVYGTVSDKNVISTYAKVTGLQSGATKEFRINIVKGILT